MRGEKDECSPRKPLYRPVAFFSLLQGRRKQITKNFAAVLDKNSHHRSIVDTRPPPQIPAVYCETQAYMRFDTLRRVWQVAEIWGGHANCIAFATDQNVVQSPPLFAVCFTDAARLCCREVSVRLLFGCILGSYGRNCVRDGERKCLAGYLWVIFW